MKALIKAGKKLDPRGYDPDVEARRLDKMSAALWPLASQGDPETVAAAVKATAKLQKAHRAQVVTRADTK